MICDIPTSGLTLGYVNTAVKFRKRVTIARIQETVADYYDIPAMEMRSARRSREVARPRQLAMYLSRQLTPNSLPDIGRRFGDRDHTTVMHAIKRIEGLMCCDGELLEDVEALRDRLAA